MNAIKLPPRPVGMSSAIAACTAVEFLQQALQNPRESQHDIRDLFSRAQLEQRPVDRAGYRALFGHDLP